MSAYWASRSVARRDQVRTQTAALDAFRMRRLRIAAAAGVLALLLALGAALEARAADPPPGEKKSRGLHGTIEVNGTQRSINIPGVNVGDSTHSDIRILGPVVHVDDGDNLVRVFSDVEVGPGERVEGDVVAVFGSATVHGTVAGNVVSVFGNANLEPGASIDGDVVAVGGVVRQPPGASIRGQSVSLGLFPDLPALPVLLGLIVFGWLITLFYAWVLNMLFPDRLLRAAITSSRRTGLSLLLGIASLPLTMIAFVLLLVTVIGVPIALLLPIFYHFLTWAGQVAASYVLGCKILRRTPGSGGAMAPIATGAAFIAAFFVAGALLAVGSGSIRTLALFFDLLGVLLLVGLSTIGTGAFLLSRFGSQPREIVPDASIPATPMPPVAPVAPYAGA